jgi:ribonuclease VapC
VIAVDTSALMAIVLNEPIAGDCIAALEAQDEIVISAGTLAEALIVSARRNVRNELMSMVLDLGFEVVTVTPAAARRIGAAYDRWGKGLHPAGLNFGDCFAYELARERACPLLYVGDDFSRTDVQSVL